jgi:adenylate kinase
MKSQTNSCAVLVTGTPGTGKTVISKLLAAQIGADYISLARLGVAHRLYSSFDRQRRTRVLDLQRTRNLLRQSLSERRRLTVVDTHVPEAVPRECVRKVIVLRCNPVILETRLRKKGWGFRKIRENALAEIVDSCYVAAVEYYGRRKLGQLDTSRTSPSKCVRQARRILDGQTPGKPRVDWIRVLDREHRLERYLG